MSDFAKVSLRCKYSQSSDYSDPKVDTRSLEYAATPDYYRYDQIKAETGGTTVECGTFSSISGIALKNLDASNFVTAAWTSNGSANSQKVVAGAVFFIPDATPGSDLVLTADTADCDCEVMIVGQKT